MKNNIYRRILHSIDREIKNAVNEQFNASDLYFGDDEPEYSVNIFNKNVFDPEKIHKKILNFYFENITIDELKDLDIYTSIIKAKNKEHLTRVCSCYIKNYPEGSLNWLDVSEITDMSGLFDGNTHINRRNIYNGDISKWDVSNVTNMKQMFYYSSFNGDIS